MNASKIWDDFQKDNHLSDDELAYLLDFYNDYLAKTQEAGSIFDLAQREIYSRLNTLNSIKYFRVNKF